MTTFAARVLAAAMQVNGIRVLLWFATLAPMAGCATLLTTQRFEDRLIRESSTRETPGEWTYSTNVAASGNNPVHVRVEVSRARDCGTITNRLVDRTEVTIRDFARPTVRPFMYAVGAGGVALAGGGAALLSLATPSPWPPDASVVNLVGWVGVIGGAALSVMLPFAIANDIRAIDSRRHLGPTPVRSHSTEVCDQGPAAGVLVTLRSGEVATSGATNAAGVADLTFHNEDLRLADGPMHIEVDGRDLGTTNALAVTHAEIAQQAASEAQRAVADAESNTGRCRDERRSELERARDSIDSLFRALASGSDPEFFRLETSRIVALGSNIEEVDFQAMVGSELQVFALAYEPVQIAVAGAFGGVASSRAPYEQIVRRVGGQTDSRVVRTSAGEHVAIGMRGRGCALLLVYSRR
jgi:hypothetical protein